MLFISPQKLFSFSAYLSFCLDFSAVSQNYLVRKIRSFSNLWLHSLVNKHLLTFINIYCPISQEVNAIGKKFGQLIECNMRNIFLEKSYTKYGGEASPRPFSEKLKLSISLNQYSKVLYSLFLLDGKLMAIEIYWK